MLRSCLYCLTLAAILAVTGCGGSESVEELRAAGQQALADRQYAAARGYFLRALQIDTADKEALMGVAEAYRLDYRLDSAIYYLKRADLMHPKDRQITEQIRVVAIALGDWKNAISAIEEMVRMGDGWEPWYEQLADLWMRNGEPGRAFYYARRAILRGTENPALYLQTSNWAARYDSLGVAIEILDSATARFGPMDEFVVNKALLLSYSGQHRRAEALLRPVVEGDSLPVPTLQLNLANILAAQPEKAKKQEALRIYQEIRDVLVGGYPVDSLIQAVTNELK